jgi:hypothetical protein
MPDLDMPDLDLDAPREMIDAELKGMPARRRRPAWI